MSLILPSFQGARLLVVGDVLLDRFWNGSTERISPEAPVPVVQIKECEDRPGGAANVAVNAAALGAQVSLLGFVGEDESADTLRTALQAAGVQHHLLPVSQAPTITKLRVLSRHQQLMRLDFESSFKHCDGQSLEQALKERVDAVDLVVFSDYLKGTLAQIEKLIDIVKQAGKTVVVDPKAKSFACYRGADMITPNLAEFTQAVQGYDDENDFLKKAEQLCRQYSIQQILLTRSEQGMTMIRPGHDALSIPTRAQEVYDVTGAGDTVVAIISIGLALGMKMEQAMMLANLGAGVVVGKLGTASLSFQELMQANNSVVGRCRGTVSEAKLLEERRIAQSIGETVVMTNGCFDILHIGHVTYLQEAKKLGDRLVVAVNSDASVRQLKGPTRPVNTVENRMQMLASLDCVDWVVEFSEETPERLIQAVQPDWLVKGGDNDPEQIPGAKSVKETGGQVIVLSYVDGVSTTGTINRIRQQKPCS